GGSLQGCNVELVHLQHGIHDSLCFLNILVLQKLAQNRGYDLPRHPELVFEPAALVFLPARGELLPQLVDLLLRLAVYEERDRRRKLEHGAAIERHEFLAFELEAPGHDRAFRSRSSFSVTADPFNLGVFKNGGIEVHCLLSLTVEPQEWSDLLHIKFSFLFSKVIQSAPPHVQA